MLRLLTSHTCLEPTSHPTIEQRVRAYVQQRCRADEEKSEEDGPVLERFSCRRDSSSGSLRAQLPVVVCEGVEDL